MKDDTNTPPWDTFTKPTCQGLHPIGARCGWCERCEWEKEQKAIYATVEVPRDVLREVREALHNVGVLSRALPVDDDFKEVRDEAFDTSEKALAKLNALLGEGE